MELEEKKLLSKKQKSFSNENFEQYAQDCNNLAEYYVKLGKYQEAATEYREQVDIYKKIPSKKLEMAKAHRMVGEMYMMMCDFENSLKHINTYQSLAQNLANKIEEQRAYATLGRVQLLYGQSLQNSNDFANSLRQLKNAEKAFIKSLLISKDLTGQINKLDQLDMQARIYLNIGVVKEQLEQFDEAISYMEKAIKISKANDLYELLHLCYISASLSHQNRKNEDSTKLALRYCNLALDVAKRLPDKVKKLCETLLTKSEILIKINDFHSAKQVLHKAYKLNTPDVNDKEIIEKSLRTVVAICYLLDSLIATNLTDYSNRKVLYDKLGDHCCILQNYDKAIEYYLKMLECAELADNPSTDLIPIYVSLYQTYKDKKDNENAFIYLWKEYELNKSIPIEAFNSLCNIAELYELQNKPFWDIHNIYDKAIKEAQKINNIKLERIAVIRLWKLECKCNMSLMADELKQQAKLKGIDVEMTTVEEEASDSEEIQENTPDIGVEICLEDLTDIESEIEEDIEKPKTLRKRTKNINIKRNNKGETHLHQACIAGNLALAQRLITQGHVVNVRDNAGWLPLHEACNHGHYSIVELLLNSGATSAINDKGGTNCDGITPLYDACSNGYLDVAELLLEHGANATIQTDYGDTALNILDKWWSKESAAEQLEQSYLYNKVRDTLIEKMDLDLSKIKSPEAIKKNLNVQFDNDGSGDEINSYDYDDDENEFENFSSANNLNVRPKRNSATGEYKAVMENLRHSNKTSLSAPCKDTSTSKRRKAFLDSEEIEVDDWLEDNMGPSTKRQRFPSTTIASKNNLNSSKTHLNRHSSFTIDPSPENSSDGNTHLESPQRQELRNSLSTEDILKKCRKQSKLKFPYTFESKSLNTEPDSTTASSLSLINLLSPEKYSQQNSAQQQSIIKPTTSFKIKVEEELLLVPVSNESVNDMNIKWLAEEASRRYYNLTGLKPVLRLMTADGFAFEETDLLSTATGEAMILSKVLEWKIANIVQRYQEISHQLNYDIDSKMEALLDTSTISNSLLLSNYCLHHTQTEPIFKALAHQTTLCILDLSFNNIQNDGCKQLAKSIYTLSQLNTLNLQGNCITNEGISYLVESKDKQLNQLDSLNLSYNPLGDRSVAFLTKFSAKCSKLKKIYLSACYITNLIDSNFNYPTLTEIDISFNKLTLNSIKHLFSKLNSNLLEILNLNCTVTNDSTNNVSINLDKFFETGTCENFKIIELSRMNLTDSCIYKITLNLCRSKLLEKINLSDNKKLTITSFRYLLERLLNLNEIVLDSCPLILKYNNLGDVEIERLPSRISLDVSNDNEKIDIKDFWFRVQGSRGKVLETKDHLILYIESN